MMRIGESRHLNVVRKGRIIVSGLACVAIAIIVVCSSQKNDSEPTESSFLIAVRPYAKAKARSMDLQGNAMFAELFKTQNGANSGGGANTVVGTGKGAGGPGNGDGPGNGAGQGLGGNGGNSASGGNSGVNGAASGGANSGGGANTVEGTGQGAGGPGNGDGPGNGAGQGLGANVGDSSSSESGEFQQTSTNLISSSEGGSSSHKASKHPDFDLKPYAESYNADRSSFLEDALMLSQRKTQYRVAREAYVAATSTFTRGLFDGVPDIHGGELCDRSRRRRYMLRNTADTSEHWKRLRLVCRRMRRKIRAVEATVDPAVGQAVQ